MTLRLPTVSGSQTIGVSTVVRRPENLWERAEREAVCSCGLIATGYRGSWAIAHSSPCPVSAAYRRLLQERDRK
jgi:hypothetical protein